MLPSRERWQLWRQPNASDLNRWRKSRWCCIWNRARITSPKRSWTSYKAILGSTCLSFYPRASPVMKRWRRSWNGCKPNAWVQTMWSISSEWHFALFLCWMQFLCSFGDYLLLHVMYDNNFVSTKLFKALFCSLRALIKKNNPCFTKRTLYESYSS